jgi:hypothetical protein
VDSLNQERPTDRPKPDVLPIHRWGCERCDDSDITGQKDLAQSWAIESGALRSQGDKANQGHPCREQGRFFCEACRISKWDHPKNVDGCDKLDHHLAHMWACQPDRRANGPLGPVG